MTGRNSWLVAYDIVDAKRLRRVYKTMRGHGDAIQYSVFHCELSAKEIELLQGRLEEMIDPREDRVFLIDLGPAGNRLRDRARFLGKQLPPQEDGPVVV